MPLYEIVRFKASGAFAADPAGTLKPATEFFAKTEGCINVYGGKAEEDDTGYLVIAWASMAHHQAIIDREGYPGFIGLSPIFKEGSELHVSHVEFIGIPEESLVMPTTETLFTSLKANKTKDDLAESLNLLMPRLTAEEGCSRTMAWGQTNEDPRVGYAFLGWASKERHLEVVGQESYTDLIGNLLNQVQLTMHHISFKKVL